MRLSTKKFKVTSFETKTLTWWRSRKEKIDMDPPYQRRGRLWSKADKAYLIDSIINGYDVPKMYIADFTWRDSPLNKKKLPYAIIDGKQRFEAIFDFFDGNLVLNENFVFLEGPSRKLGGLGYRDLQRNHADIAEVFDNYNLMVISVIAETQGPINELFVRLNRSKSLTGAEIRNAMRGPAPAVIREIAKHDYFQTNVRFSVKRGADLNAAAKALLFEYGGQPRETKKTNLDSFVKELVGKKRDKLELAMRRVMETFSDMAEIFLPRDTLLSSAGVVPVYYWFVRGKKEDEFPYIREFLVEFDRERRQNRKVIDDPLDSSRVDKTMLDYDSYNRSPNDLASYNGRHKILNERFSKWLRKRERSK